jgi:hypothetical protein
VPYFILTPDSACFLIGYTEDGGDIFLRNVGELPMDYTALYPRRQYRCENLTSKAIIQLFPTKPPGPMSAHPAHSQCPPERCCVPAEVTMERLLCHEPAHKQHINAFCHSSNHLPTSNLVQAPTLYTWVRTPPGTSVELS